MPEITADIDDALLALAARTADVDTGELENRSGYRGVLLAIEVTALAVTPSVVPTLQVQNGQGNWSSIYTGTAFTAVGLFTYLIHPDADATFDGTDIGAVPLPRRFRLLFDHADADSITYDCKAFWLH